jgi:hypothetical protein
MENTVTVSYFGLSTILPSSFNTSANALPFSPPALQVKCRSGTALTHNWATGRPCSAASPKKACWILNEKRSSTSLGLNFLSGIRRNRTHGICNSKSCRTIMENMAAVNAATLSRGLRCGRILHTSPKRQPLKTYYLLVTDYSSGLTNNT